MQSELSSYSFMSMSWRSCLLLQNVQFLVMPISLGDLDNEKEGAQRLLLVRYTRGLYDPGPGTGSVESYNKAV